MKSLINKYLDLVNSAERLAEYARIKHRPDIKAEQETELRIYREILVDLANAEKLLVSTTIKTENYRDIDITHEHTIVW